jgi:hypothetical protein
MKSKSGKKNVSWTGETTGILKASGQVYKIISKHGCILALCLTCDL